MPARLSAVLDTDIGSDVDDAMALALVLGTPSIDLAAVTTVYGDTLLRARLARRYASLAGVDVPVHAGAAEPRSGRAVWWAGHEGSLHDDLRSERVEPEAAADALVRLAAASPGRLDVLAVGPLTNVAAALDADPAFAANVRTLWVMGGDFVGDEAEHNLRSDAAAARAVFASGVETVVCGLDVTRRVVVAADGLARIRAAGPLGAALGRDIDQWWAYWDKAWNVPHDPVTVLALARPDLFELSGPGRVEVAVGGDDEGRARFVADPAGSTRVVRALDAAAVAEAVVAGIVAAGSLSPRTC